MYQSPGSNIPSDENPVVIASAKGNSKKIAISLGVILVVVIAAFIFFYLQASSTISSNNDAIFSLTQNVLDLNSRTADLESRNTNLNTKITESENLNKELDTKLAQSEGLNVELDTKIASLEEDNDELNAQFIAVQSEASATKSQVVLLQQKLDIADEKITLYEGTYGSIYSGVQPKDMRFNYTLYNNPDAQNPTYFQLSNFLYLDTTDRNTYVPASYMCGHFARDLHNNAEQAGIKSAFVMIWFEGELTGHACNAFLTTDRGLIFIDDTGVEEGDFSLAHQDKYVELKIGEDYIPSLFTPDPSYYVTYYSLGVVSEIELFW
jgi:hypothetical protein